MSKKTFLVVSCVIFSVVAAVHAARWVFHWQAIVGGWVVPLYASLIGAIVSCYLAFTAFRLSQSE